MKCPNCQKEAINVNGRFVCLDCGLELSPDNNLPKSMTQTQPISSVGSSRATENIEPPSQGMPFSQSNPTPIIIEPPANPMATPLTDAYKEELENSNPGDGFSPESEKQDIGVTPANNLEVPDFPADPNQSEQTPTQVNNFPVSPEAVKISSESPSTTGLPDNQTVIQDQEKEKILATNSQEQNHTDTDPTSTGSETEKNQDISNSNNVSSNQNQYFQPASMPIGDNLNQNNQIGGITSSLLSTKETEGEGEVKITVPDQPKIEGWPEEKAAPQIQKYSTGNAQTGSGADSSLAETPSTNMGTPPEDTLTIPDNNNSKTEYQQTTPPLNGSIPNMGPEVKSQDPFNQLPDNEPKPEVPEKIITPTEPAPPPPEFVTQEKKLNPSDLTSSENRPPNIDELLKKYSGGGMEGASSPPPFKPEYPTNNFVEEINREIPKSRIPGTGNIPSPESVFGPSKGQKSNVNSFNVSGPKKSRRFLIIMFAVLGATIMVAVGIYLGINMLRPDTTPSVSGQEKLFEISDVVSKTMDRDMDIVVRFRQSIDFSRAELKKTDLITNQKYDRVKFLFSSPVISEGEWQANGLGDVAIDVNQNGSKNKAVYLKTKNISYRYSSEKNSWTKEPVMETFAIPEFYSIQNKGGIFYMTKASEVKYLSDESVNDVNCKKFQIIPKNDLIKAALRASSSLLGEVIFEDMSSEGFKLEAWVDEQNRIIKITANGDILVKSDLFDGVVTFDTEANYDYKNVMIQSPETKKK